MRSLTTLAAAAAAALVVAACLAAASRPLEEPAAEPVTVFLLRHAEKATNDPNDPDLSEAGLARAEALARLLEPAGVTHLFATEWKRTKQTLAPLAERTGRPIEIVAAGRGGELVDALRALPAGAKAVVAGHSNTIPPLVKQLGGSIAGTITTPQGEQLPDAEYGRLLILLLSPPPSPRALTTLTLHAGS